MAIIKKINIFLIYLSAAGIFAVVTVTLADILIDLVTGRPLSGVYDIVESAMACVVFLCLPEVFRTRQNIVVDVVDYLVPTVVRDALILFAHILTLIFTILITYSLLAPFQDAYQFGDIKYDTGIPVWLIFIPALVGLAFSVISAASMLTRVQPINSQIQD